MSNSASSTVQRVHQLDPDAVDQPDDAVLRLRRRAVGESGNGGGDGCPRRVHAINICA
jgi:hypothetical protein